MCHSHQSKRVLDSACPGQYTLENNIAILQFTDFLVLHSPSDKYTKLMKLVHSCLHLWKIEKSSSRLERLLVWYPKAETIVPPKINRKKNFVRLFLVTAKGKCNRPWAEHLVSYFCSEPADNLKCRQVKYEEVLRKKLGFGRHRLRGETRLVAYCRFFPPPIYQQTDTLYVFVHCRPWIGVLNLMQQRYFYFFPSEWKDKAPGKKVDCKINFLFSSKSA